MTEIKTVFKYCCILLLSTPIFASDEPAASPSRHARAIAEANAFAQEAEAIPPIPESPAQRLEAKMICMSGDPSKVKRIPIEGYALVPIMDDDDEQNVRIKLGGENETITMNNDMLFLEGDKVFIPKFLINGTKITRLREEIPMEKSEFTDADGNKVVVGHCLFIQDYRIFRPRFVVGKDGKTTYTQEELKIKEGKLVLPINLEGECHEISIGSVEDYISNPEKTPEPKFPVAGEHIHAVEFTRDGQQIRYSITKIPHYDEFKPVQTLKAYLYLWGLGFYRERRHEVIYAKNRAHLDCILYSRNFEHSNRSTLLRLSHKKNPSKTLQIYTEFIQKQDKRVAKEHGPNFLYTEENSESKFRGIKLNSAESLDNSLPFKFFADLFQSRRSLYIIDPTQLNRDFDHFYLTITNGRTDAKIKQCVECPDNERIKNIDELIEMFNNWAIEDDQENKKIVPLMYYVKMIKDAEGKSVPEYWAYNIYSNEETLLSGDFKHWQGVLDETIEKKEEAMRKIEDSAVENPKYMTFLHRYRDSRSESPVKSRKSQSPSKSPSKSLERSPEMSESRGSNELASKAEGLNELRTNGSGTQTLGASKSARKFPTLRPQSRRPKVFFPRSASI